MPEQATAASTHVGNSKAPLARFFALSIACGLGCLAVAAFAASTVSLQTFLHVTVGSNSDDQVLRGMGTIAQTFNAITMRLRYFSVATFGGAVLVFSLQRQAAIWIEEVVLRIPQFVRLAAGSIMRTLSTDEIPHKLVLAALFVVGFIIRLRLLFRPIEFDEADTFITFASRPLPVALSWYSEPNNHLLNTLLMHFFWRLLGDAEWVLRLPAFCAGCLIIPLSYWAARMLYNKHVALIATALVATAQALVVYSIEARGYTLQCAFFLLFVIASQRLLDQDAQPGWFFWILFATLGFYALPTMLYGIAMITLWLLYTFLVSTQRELRPRRIAYLGAAVGITAGLVGLLYSPVLIGTGLEAVASDRYLRSRTFSFVFSKAPTVVGQIWSLWTTHVPIILVWVFAAGLVIGILGHRRIASYPLPILAPLIVSIPTLVLAQRVVPIARIWTFLLPLFAATSAAGLWFALAGLKRGFKPHYSRISVAATVGLLCLTIIPDLRGLRLRTPVFDGAEQSAVWVNTHLNPADALLVVDSIRAPMLYYFRRHGAHFINRPALCNSQAVAVFAAKSVFAGEISTHARLFMLVHRDKDWRQSYGTCLAGGRKSASARLAYSAGEMELFENSEIQPEQWPLLGFRKR